MLKFHSFCFTDWRSFASWVGEILIVLDAGLAVVTLGVVELNLSVVYFHIMEAKYGSLWTQEERDKW
jgi:hypothetical protein